MVAIKDMAIPTCCASCFAQVMVDGIVHTYEMCELTQSVLSVDDLTEKRHKDCPLVEVKPLTDSEQRIFLSAMSREMSICKQIDNDKVDDSTVKKLVPIVNTIERKIKKVLWN